MAMRADEADRVEDEVARRLDAAAARLVEAKSVLFVTGAGISADSGVPTYRGVGGLYDDAATPEGIPIEEIVSGPMFRARPELTWKYLRLTEEACRGARPNRAHEFLAFVERWKDRTCVLTQNVDGLHRAAGSRNVIEIHGDIHEVYCTGCGRRETVADFSRLEPCPRCADCGAVRRPDVVLFGELLPAAKVARMHAEIERGFDLVFAIGTTAVFPYIVAPVREAKLRGRPTVEINPATTEISDLVDIRLPLRAAEACEALWRRVAPAARTAAATPAEPKTTGAG